jgi:hypothetical protein
MGALMPWVHLLKVMFFSLDKGKMTLVGCCLSGKMSGQMRGGDRFWKLRRKAMVSYCQESS